MTRQKSELEIALDYKTKEENTWRKIKFFLNLI